MRVRRLLIALACLALIAPLALAQTTGDVSGVARDKDGSPLPGVLVTITGPGAPKGRTVTTKADGAFRFGSLAPGTYRLKAELSGMAAFEQEVKVGLQKDTEVRPVLAATATGVAKPAAPSMNAPNAKAISRTWRRRSSAR